MEQAEGIMPPEISKPDLRTPYCVAMMEKAEKKIPDVKQEMKIILGEIDRQAVDNFGLFKPVQFPGTEISYIKLTVGADLIHKIAGAESELPIDQEGASGKNEIAFLFTAMGKPPDGNAFTAQDMGIDRFIRNIPKVAHAIKRGEPVPNVEIYLLGSGTGYGEKASQNLIDQINERGLEVRGEIYAEFIEKALAGKDLGNTSVLLQGVSMGTTTADKTFDHLPDPIKGITQRLFDNPAGTHNPSTLSNVVRGGQAIAGLGAEFAARELLDPVAKALGRTKIPFRNYLYEQKGIKEDTPLEKKAKDDLFRAAGFKLVQGSPLNTDERSYIRRGIKDPLTTTPARIINVAMRKGRKIQTHEGKEATIQVPMDQKGRALEVPINRTHFFIYENFPRWKQIINDCKNVGDSQTVV